MTTLKLSLVLVALALCTSPGAAVAQSGPSTGVGVQLGSPTGVSVRVVRDAEPHYDFLAAWDFDDFLFLNANLVWERKVEEGVEVDLRMFYGPGAGLGLRDRPGGDDIVLGAGGVIGAALWVESFELFAQLIPQLELVPATDFVIHGGIGVRYHFAR